MTTMVLTPLSCDITDHIQAFKRLGEIIEEFEIFPDPVTVDVIPYCSLHNPTARPDGGDEECADRCYAGENIAYEYGFRLHLDDQDIESLLERESRDGVRYYKDTLHGAGILLTDSIFNRTNQSPRNGRYIYHVEDEPMPFSGRVENVDDAMKLLQELVQERLDKNGCGDGLVFDTQTERVLAVWGCVEITDVDGIVVQIAGPRPLPSAAELERMKGLVLAWDNNHTEGENPDFVWHTHFG